MSVPLPLPARAARPMRIVLAISTLGAGGAERVITLLANSLAERGHEITLVTLMPVAQDFFRSDARVVRIALGWRGPSRGRLDGLYANALRARAIRRIVRRARAEVVIAFMTDMNVVCIVACLGLPVAVFASERIDPRAHDVGRVWNWLRRLTYRRAAGLVVQTEAVAAWFQAAYPARVTVIPNPVVATVATAAAAPPATATPYLFAAGRLNRQKGFDVLIRAMAILAADGLLLELVIAGEGPEQGALLALATQLGLTSRVRLLGRVPELSSWMAGALGFVLASRYEGFPNVLVEALAHGTPVIATDCPSGPREILENGKYGLLVPCEDPAALAQAVLTLAADVQLQARLRELGPRAVDRFRLPAVVARWESLLQAAVTP